MGVKHVNFIHQLRRQRSFPPPTVLELRTGPPSQKSVNVSDEKGSVWKQWISLRRYFHFVKTQCDMYNVWQTTEFMPKFRERTMPSKFSSCDNALPSRSTGTSLVLKRAKFRNHQLHFLTLITTNIITQEEAKMPLCKLKKNTKTKNKGVITCEEASPKSSNHRSFVYRLKR